MRLVVDHGPNRQDGVSAFERRIARQHGVQHAAQRKQITPPVDRLVVGLFRRKITRRAHDSTFDRQPRLRFHQAGDAEIEQLDVRRIARSRFFQPDVGRLDVAIDQAFLVRSSSPSATSRVIRSASETGNAN